MFKELFNKLLLSLLCCQDPLNMKFFEKVIIKESQLIDYQLTFLYSVDITFHFIE